MKCSSQMKLSNTPLLCKNGLLDRGIKTIGPKQSGQILPIELFTLIWTPVLF